MQAGAYYDFFPLLLDGHLITVESQKKEEFLTRLIAPRARGGNGWGVGRGGQSAKEIILHL